MPDYIAPGVYVEENCFGGRPIQGVATSTVGFVGECADGPIAGLPHLVTSFKEFQHTFGSLEDLVQDGTPRLNHLAHAVRLFFENGGQRACIARISRADGLPATPTEFTGSGSGPSATGLAALGEVEDIAIVVAPGAGSLAAAEDCRVVRQSLLDHCEKHRYRFAILSGSPDLDADGIRQVRAEHDSSQGALYFPWLVVQDPTDTTGRPSELMLAPDGALAGIYARTDSDRGVHQAPANVEVRGILRFSQSVDAQQQEVLNPEGINCLRSFAGRGHLVWGARTMSFDSEWRYVNVRRTMIYLEHSIDRGLQWVVFEPNQEQLWERVRQAIETFLQSAWKAGALLGSTPGEAFFVKCDRTTMTKADLDHGRLVGLIGMAPSHPAEFTVLGFSQWTADRPAH